MKRRKRRPAANTGLLTGGSQSEPAYIAPRSKFLVVELVYMSEFDDANWDKQTNIQTKPITGNAQQQLGPIMLLRRVSIREPQRSSLVM